MARRPPEREGIYLDRGRRTTQLMRDSLGRSPLYSMRFATLGIDSWQLDSGEARHDATPETFWIPPLDARESLQRGQAAKLLFEIQSQDEQGKIEIFTERMWVLVTERLEAAYLGILANQPISVELEDSFYLQHGSEIPFGPEHVIDIDDLSPELVAEILATGPRRRWPRDEAAA